ncbi:MAG: hypothetical protein NPMRTH4_1180005 [Nitrosopumilales archaeon]|nr:MAG: hypothetical protein NPMRTH4_1180005 [Nitrosopumilales archaeon]
MKSSKKGVIIFMIIAVLFGYSQYALATQIGVVVTESALLEEDDTSSTHDIKLEFDNPTLLTLTAGDTEFIIYADDEKIGDGTLEPFVLFPLDKSLVDGTFQTESKSQSEDDPAIVKISGVTTYDVLFTSIDVPFIYYPSEEQAREFIHQN